MGVCMYVCVYVQVYAHAYGGQRTHLQNHLSFHLYVCSRDRTQVTMFEQQPPLPTEPSPLL